MGSGLRGSRSVVGEWRSGFQVWWQTRFAPGWPLLGSVTDCPWPGQGFLGVVELIPTFVMFQCPCDCSCVWISLRGLLCWEVEGRLRLTRGLGRVPCTLVERACGSNGCWRVA